MAQLRGSARFAHKPLPRNLALKIGGVDHLERDVDTQTGIERLVSDSHRAASQLERRTILAR